MPQTKQKQSRHPELNLDSENVAKATKLYNKYYKYIHSAVNKCLNADRTLDNNDMLSHVTMRFWVSCLKAKKGLPPSSYLYSSAQFACKRYVFDTYKMRSRFDYNVTL